MKRTYTVILLLFATLVSALQPCRSEAAEVIVVGDTQLKPVVEIIAGIRKTLDASLKAYSPAEVKGRLAQLVEKENVKVVITLGREAMNEALHLPPTTPVIFDLVVTPPPFNRPNTTGFYMATPVREYAELIKNHLHAIKQVAVVGSRDQLRLLVRDESPQVSSYSVRSPSDLVSTVNRLDTADAILLLPDVSLLTASAMEETYLLSFRKGIPLLGISERHVKEGALLALVVDPVNVGKQIGEYATRAVKGGSVGQIPPSPPRKFELYVNTSTARKMGIPIPNEVIRMAKRVYQ